jgi:D-lactate dehydrogenase
MKIAVFEIEPWMEDHIRALLPDQEIIFTKEPLTESNASEFSDIEAVSVFVFSKVTSGVIASLPQLKLISARSTGYDHIDLKSAKEKDIIVTNVPTYGSITVAEHTWSLILAVSRNLALSHDRTEKADFDIAGLRGFDLEGKTLGLAGLGEIGRKVAQMSQGFGMKLRVFSRSQDQEFASQFDNCVFVDRIEDVLTHSDVISFHVPLVKETFHLVNIDNYHHLKKGCIIINTSRGPIIETKALIKGLQDGIIRGAGLDVLESEAVIKDERLVDIDHLPQPQELTEAYLNHVLIDMDNVIITPHNAFNSDESIIRLVNTNIQNIIHFANGESSKLDEVK